MPAPPPATLRDKDEGVERWPARLVGERLREARRRRGFTLDHVAGAAGFTKSFLSAVERGETSPSIGSLYSICEVLGITMSALFEPAEAPESTVVRRADVEGTFFGAEGVVNYALSPHGERRAQVIETHIAPGGSPGPDPWSRPGELVMATVLEGAVEFRFGERTATLQAGDTVSYSPAEPHCRRNPDGENPAVALFIEVPAEY